MKEKIQEDRQNVKQGHCSASFSYVPFLTATTKVSLKLSKLTTINILYYLEESFKKGDKYILKNLDKIKNELRSRKDIFQTALIYLQNKIVKDDLFYWIPGQRISNIFCFIIEILPSFIEDYKRYYIEMIVTNRKYYDVLHFIKSRYEQEYSQFKLMQIDLELFPCCISSTIWIGEEPNKYGSSQLDEYLNRYLNISEDIEAILVPQASFIEISMGAKNMIVSVEKFEGLLQNEEKHKQYWIDNGTIDSNWNYL